MTRSTAQRRLSPQPPEQQRRTSPRKSARRMAPVTDNAPLSDTETSEKPVREQFQKATLANLPGDANATGAAVEIENGEGMNDMTERGRLHRKRSFEEVEGEQAEQGPTEIGKQHTRKRSRDGAEEEAEISKGKRISSEKTRDAADITHGIAETNGESKAASRARPATPEQNGKPPTEATVEEIASPKTKRSRLHSTAMDEDGKAAPEQPPSEPTAPALDKDAAAEPATKAAETTSSTGTSAAEVLPTSGFANTSVTSPFGALAGSKSPTSDEPQTSSGAFAASGFGSLVGSSSSGFGAIGKSTGGFGAGGGFGSGGKSPLGGEASKENEKPKEASGSAFGGNVGQKSAFAAAPATTGGFGSALSGFGKLGGGGGGFGGTLGGSGFSSLGGGGLPSFASGKAPAPLAGSSKPGRAFGAAADDDDEADGGEDDDAGFKSPLSQEEDKQDERFYEQHLETGEEDEVAVYSCRAKLYNFTAVGENEKKEWRERGLGVLRLNVKRPGYDDPDDKVKARFLMRADGSHRVVLNTPVKKEISFGAATGGPPQGGYMLFMGTIEGKSTLELLQLKIKQQFALELYDKVTELQKEM